MNNKTLLVIIIALVLIGGIVLVIYLSGAREDSGMMLPEDSAQSEMWPSAEQAETAQNGTSDGDVEFGDVPGGVPAIPEMPSGADVAPDVAPPPPPPPAIE